MERWAGEVARSFGLGEPATMVGPVDRGELGEVWRLQSSSGRYAVKVPFAPVEPAEMAEPAAFARAASDGGVPTACFRRTHDGDLVADVGGRQVLVLEWLDMAGPDDRLDPLAVGELLATLHAVPFVGTRAPSPWFSEAVGTQVWAELVEAAARAHAPFVHELADYVPELVALEALLDPLPADRTCHRDLWPDNLRATTGGGLCLFDWDSCGPANQAEEVAQVLFAFGSGDVARHRALYTAYKGSGGAATVRDTRAFSMVIAVLGHIGRYDIRGWLDAAPGSPERRRREERVAEFLGRAPYPRFDRRAIEAILDHLG